TFGSILCVASLGVFVLGPGCSTGAESEHVGEADEHLTAAQCDAFDVNGKVTICHYTGSEKHPYTTVKISEQGGIDGHPGHPHEYGAGGDPTCQGGGGLPQNPPCD